MLITIKQWSAARYKIKRFYNLNHEILDSEIQAEIDNLARRKACGTLDDTALALYCELTTGEHPIKF